MVPSSTTAPSRASSWHVLGVLAGLMGFASISTDFYLPAMPRMATALHAGPGALELTITGFLVGLSLGQLAWGPISDRYGRRLPVALGLGLFVMGSAGCALAGDVLQIVLWRVVQALGASASIVLSRAMVRDLFEGPRAARVMSLLIAVMTIAPLVAPGIGAVLVEHVGWRAIFWLLVAIGLGTLGALATLPETLPPERRVRDGSVGVLRRYVELLGDRRVLGFALVCGCFYIGMFGYIAASPFAYIDYHGLAPSTYALIFATGIVGITTATLANTRLVDTLGPLPTLRLGTTVAAIAGVVMAGVAATDLGGAWGPIPPQLAFLAATGLIIPNALAGALEDRADDAGAVSALTGAFQYGGGIFGSALAGVFANGTAAPLGAIVALAGVGTLAAGLLLTDPRTRTP